MNHILFTIVLLGTLGLSQSGHARSPLLYHGYHSGFGSQEPYSMNCEIFSDHVKATIVNAQEETRTVHRPVTLPDNINALIDGASKGLLISFPAPADIGTSLYHAYLPNDNDTLTTVDLGSVIDSQVKTINRAPEASELKEIIDVICSELKVYP